MQGTQDPPALVAKHAQLVQFNPGLFYRPCHLPEKWWSFPRRLLSIDGIRGSGKSTLLAELLKVYPQLIHYPPPVPRFEEAFATSPGSEPAKLDLNRVERWWWDFGRFVLDQGGSGANAPNETRTFVIEGSLGMSIFLYAQYLEHVGRIPKPLFARLVQMFKRSQRSLVMRSGDTIYVQVDHQVAFNRLKSRADPQDGNISVEFQRVCVDRLGQLCMFGGFQGWDHVVDGNKPVAEMVGEAKKTLGPNFGDNSPLRVAEIPTRVRRRHDLPAWR